jgi:hypothetical protein
MEPGIISDAHGPPRDQGVTSLEWNRRVPQPGIQGGPMAKRLLTIFAAVLLAACAGDPLGSTPAPVRAEPSGDAAVAVTNTGDLPVYYRIVNPDAFASWMPCTSPADCPAIRPGETVRIAYSQIGLYQPDSTQAELYWWRFTRVGDAYVSVDEGRLRIRL